MTEPRSPFGRFQLPMTFDHMTIGELYKLAEYLVEEIDRREADRKRNEGETE